MIKKKILNILAVNDLRGVFTPIIPLVLLALMLRLLLWCHRIPLLLLLTLLFLGVGQFGIFAIIYRLLFTTIIRISLLGCLCLLSLPHYTLIWEHLFNIM